MPARKRKLRHPLPRADHFRRYLQDFWLFYFTSSPPPLLFSEISWEPACSVMSDSLWSHGLWPTRPLCPWDFLGKNTGVGCQFLLQGLFPTKGLNLCPLHWQADFYHWATREPPPLDYPSPIQQRFSKKSDATYLHFPIKAWLIMDTLAMNYSWATLLHGWSINFLKSLLPSKCLQPCHPSFWWLSNFNWSIVALQCSVSFCYTAKWISYTY